MAAPRVVIIAGPNGAGKSTSAAEVLQGPLGVHEFVNADSIARGLSAFSPERVAWQAGRIMLGRIAELCDEQESFAFETTLATRSFAPLLRKQIVRGYEFHLIYLWLPDVELAIERVRIRVRRGGHNVPSSTIRRRYVAGARNFTRIYRELATTWQVADNSGRYPQLIAHGSSVGQSVQLPDQWQRFLASAE